MAARLADAAGARHGGLCEDFRPEQGFDQPYALLLGAQWKGM